MTNIQKYFLIYLAGILSGYVTYQNLQQSTRNSPTQITASQYQSINSTNSDLKKQAITINLSNSQLGFISEQLISKISYHLDDKFNQLAETYNTPPDKQLKMKQQSNNELYSSILSQIETPGFFNSNMTIDDFSNSEEMKNLNQKEQFSIMKNIFGRLNTGQLSKEQVFGASQ
ncbi:MAG: hypothetical protein QM479_07920 [Pseudomonadota bacterium]